MRQQQNRILILITVFSLGLIAGLARFILWVANDGIFPKSKASNQVDSSATLNPSSIKAIGLTTIQDVPQGIFNYGGSTTWIPTHEPIKQAISDAFPEFQLRYVLPTDGSPPGSGSGIQMLLDGQLAFSESSRPVKPKEYAAAQSRGFGLKQIPVALDGIALAVHPALDIEGVTVKQIRAIYTGEITNWSQVGGPSIPIKAYSRSVDAAGTAKFFLKDVVGADSYGENVIFVEDTTTGVRKVLNDKGGIYFASAPEIVKQCSIYAIPVAADEQPGKFTPPFTESWRTGDSCLQQANTVNKEAFSTGNYPLTRRLFVVIKTDAELDTLAGQ
ncbi:MAG: substrate-binding domain-containing protein, partial [Cyanobacteria bacterium J06642_11]